MLPTDPFTALKSNGAPEWGSLEVIPAQNDSAAALRLHTTRRPPQRYHLQARFVTDAPITRGDTLLVSFAARAVEASPETDAAALGISVQANTSPYRTTFNGFIHVGREWRTFQLPFRSDATFAAGSAQLCLQAGVDPQIVEVRELALSNFGTDVEVRDLPATRLVYAGHAADAPWREEARRRIDRYRKGDLTVIVQDGSGQPLPGATVNVTMRRHAFKWGSAVTAQMLTEDTPDAQVP